MIFTFLTNEYKSKKMDTALNNWKLKEIDPLKLNQILSYMRDKDFKKDFNFDLANPDDFKKILSTILFRRGITEGKDLLYFLEKDLRYQHSPFLMNSVEDGIERILQALEEQEKVLIYGDSDVDGITSIAILYGYLKKIGLDVEWELPSEEDGYGLSIKAIDSFAGKQGTLIITVDCGISNFEEINHANELGIDVIVTDHHNPPETLPEAIITIDPKTDDSGYPFTGISGAAVAYKLVSALRFARTDFYNQELCLFNIQENKQDNCFEIDCVKVCNLVIEKELHEKLIPGKTSIYDLKFINFICNSLIFSWDTKSTLNLLSEICGANIDFNIYDLKNEVCNIFPGLRTKSAQDLMQLSSLGKYISEEQTVIKSLYNIYVTYTKALIAKKYPEDIKDEKNDLQLVALAALADIMPMQNENRIFVRNGIEAIKESVRPGLRELISELKLDPQHINSTDLSWSVIPALNATGRLDKPYIAVNLLLSEDYKERETLAAQIVELNEKRKDIVNQTIFRIHDMAKESLSEYDNKLCVVINNDFHSGLTGLFASRLMSDFHVPSIIVSVKDDVCTGSMRSNRGFIATSFLDSLDSTGDIFINHGGHNCAAGFSFTTDKLDLFISKLHQAVPNIILEEDKPEYVIDANIPPKYLTPDLFKMIDFFEPYGSDNTELILKSENLFIFDAIKFGKKDPMHLKLTLDSGENKYPAMFWGQGDLLNNQIQKNNNCDIIYTLNNRYTASNGFYAGMFTKQLIIKEIKN